MPSVEAVLTGMKHSARGVRYRDLCRVCDQYFGKPRQRGTSHRVYRTPWPGNPRVNIQNADGFAKPYQVRQVLTAIVRLERNDA